MKKYFLQTCLISLLATFVSSTQTPTLARWIGTWTLNLEKSQLEEMIALEPAQELWPEIED
jgi:hypothetical protein